MDDCLYRVADRIDGRPFQFVRSALVRVEKEKDYWPDQICLGGLLKLLQYEGVREEAFEIGAFYRVYFYPSMAGPFHYVNTRATGGPVIVRGGGHVAPIPLTGGQAQFLSERCFAIDGYGQRMFGLRLVAEAKKEETPCAV